MYNERVYNSQEPLKTRNGNISEVYVEFPLILPKIFHCFFTKITYVRIQGGKQGDEEWLSFYICIYIPMTLSQTALHESLAYSSHFRYNKINLEKRFPSVRLVYIFSSNPYQHSRLHRDCCFWQSIGGWLLQQDSNFSQTLKNIESTQRKT